MKKLLISAAVAAAAFGGQAQAAVPLLGGVPDVATVATSYAETFGAGSTAADVFLEESLRTACNGTIYKYAVTPAGGTAISVYLCEKDAAVTFNPAIAQTYLVFQKGEAGSIQGVTAATGTNPTYVDWASLASATACTVPGANEISTCTGMTATTKVAASELNFSDVEPQQFKSALNGGFTGAIPAASPVAAQVFGVVVNTRLRDALQAAQIAGLELPATCTVGSETEECMPSLTSAQIASVISTGHVQDWRNLRNGSTAATQNLWNAVAAADQPSNRGVHVCTRTAGSGTWALFNVKFHNAPCNNGADEALQTPKTQTLGTEVLNSHVKVVHAMTGSGDVENCLEGLNDNVAKGTFTPATQGITGFRWAIGIMGTERNATGAKKYRFIKVDGIAPSSQNVVEGKYKYWGELVSVGNAPTDALAINLLATMADPNKIANLDVIGTWGKETGYLGAAFNPVAANLPTFNTLVSAQMNASWDADRPVAPYSHATGTGASLNHCRVPTIPNGNRAMPIN